MAAGLDGEVSPPSLFWENNDIRPPCPGSETPRHNLCTKYGMS